MSFIHEVIIKIVIYVLLYMYYVFKLCITVILTAIQSDNYRQMFCFLMEMCFCIIPNRRAK